jgi:hypothetical protein
VGTTGQKDDMQKEGTRQIFGKTEIGGDSSYCGHLVYDIMQSGEDSGSRSLQISSNHLAGHKINL